MAAGTPYFAWIDASETTFTEAHLRWDESIFSFTLSQEEGDPASLTVAIRRPYNSSGNMIGLLGPGRKIWCWFALDCGPALVTFRGRLVGIPTNIFEELITLEFVARPSDVVAQKETVANSLRVLPYYDPALIDPARRSDPDVVLEGYTKIWHFDPSSHVVTVSDEVIGEDGIVIFDGATEDGKILYDGLGMSLTSGPLSRVDVSAEFTWTQMARGTVDLTGYLMSHWPGVEQGVIPGLNAQDWPKHGASLGDSWEVAETSAYDVYDFSVHTDTKSGGLILEEGDGSTSSVNWSQTTGAISGGFATGGTVTEDTYSVTFDSDGDGGSNASVTRTYSDNWAVLTIQSIRATLVAGYKAERPFTERVSLTLFANVQHILTDPEDGEALRIDDIRSVNLSESIDAEVPIEDTRRRSYIATERGNRSLEYLILLARAHLMKRARVVEIAFAPKLSRMPEITLRKSAYLAEPRIGEALGKIINYSIALDGSDGRIKCEVRIGCTIGRSGTVTAAVGEGSYATSDYVGPDYQTFIGRTVLVDTSVGYEPPAANPNDDGLNFLSGFSAEDIIDSGLVVEKGPDPDEDIVSNSGSGAGTPAGGNSDVIAARDQALQATLPKYETRAKFKLKSMTREFASDYQLQVTQLEIPAGYNLEAV